MVEDKKGERWWRGGPGRSPTGELRDSSPRTLARLILPGSAPGFPSTCRHLRVAMAIRVLRNSAGANDCVSCPCKSAFRTAVHWAPEMPPKPSELHRSPTSERNGQIMESTHLRNSQGKPRFSIKQPMLFRASIPRYAREFFVCTSLEMKTWGLNRVNSSGGIWNLALVLPRACCY